MSSEGWNSQHPLLSSSIEELRPKTILEVGTWKGASAIFMAKVLEAFGLNDSRVICVDTFLGSSEHWLNESLAKLLEVQDGRPTIFEQFRENIAQAGVADKIMPLTLDSWNASIVIKGRGWVPQMIHLDGCHDFQAVKFDLHRYWPLLAPHGHFIVDDYGGFVGVTNAVNEFSRANKIDLEVSPPKALMRK